MKERRPCVAKAMQGKEGTKWQRHKRHKEKKCVTCDWKNNLTFRP